MLRSDFENHLDESEPKWFAVRTRYKCEKLVQKQLSNKKIYAYLPIQQFIRRYERKVKKVELPLISCYVFVKIIKPEYVKVLETENVAGFVKFSKNLISIPEDEMELMRKVIAEGVEVEAVPSSDLLEGDFVEINYGRLLGMKGRLLEIQGKHKVMVALDHLGYTLQISVDPKWIQKASA